MASSVNQPGVLLVNTGTPDSPLVRDVRRFLREFLMDPRVIDLPGPLRWLLVHGLILPFRPRRSAAAYRSIWTDHGSPLLVHSRALADHLRHRLGDRVPVELGMRYGNPSIAGALLALRRGGADRLVVVPLFPQYSPSAWGSAVQHVYREAGRLWNVPALQVVPPYFDHPAFVEATVAVARPVLEECEPERTLFSFHGQPERHCRRADDSEPPFCLQQHDCCAYLSAVNRSCYRAQCYATAHALASALELTDDDYEICFQSRMGRAAWIGPPTDERLAALAADGVRRVAVLCPSFVTDCLETVEEIAIRSREQFRARGGGNLRLVPCVNASDGWVDGLVTLTRPLMGDRRSSSL